MTYVYHYFAQHFGEYPKITYIDGIYRTYAPILSGDDYAALKEQVTDLSPLIISSLTFLHIDEEGGDEPGRH